MPKVVDTRKQRAKTLLSMLRDGPGFQHKPYEGEFTPKEARITYRIWAESWIIEELIDLVPELRKEKNNA